MSLAATLLVLFIFPPKYSPITAITAVPETGAGSAPDFALGRVPGLLQQFNHPFGWEHFGPEVPNAIRWRLLPPVLGRLLRLSPAGYFTLPYLGVLLMLAAVAYHARGRGGSDVGAVCTTLLAATSSPFFVSTGWVGQFDAFYVFGLILFVFADRNLTLWAVCSLAPWCDERFLLILPACAVLRYVRLNRADWLIPSIVGLTPYVVMRLWATLHGDVTIGRQFVIPQQAYGEYLRHVPIGWWMGFRAGWALIGAGLVAIWVAARRRAIALGLALVAGLSLITALAWDLSRSIGVLLPFLVYGAVVLPQPRRKWRFALVVLVLLNLTLPVSHVVAYLHVPVASRFAALLQSLRSGGR